jgi:hypothetical protein
LPTGGRWGTGRASALQGHYGEARARLEESLALARESGVPAYEATALHLLGHVAAAEGLAPLAWERYAASLDIFRAGDHQTAVGVVLGDMGNLARAEGDLARARRLWAESAGLARHRPGHRLLVAWTLGNAGALLALAGDDRRAVHLLGAAAAAHPSFPLSLDPDEREACRASQAAARAALGEAAFEAAWAAGRAMAPEGALAAAERWCGR